jgi:hypothetical protein
VIIRAATSRGRFVVLERQAHLGEHDVVQDGGTGDPPDAVGPGTGPLRQPGHQLGDPVAAERAQHDPHRDAAGPAGQLQNPLVGSPGPLRSAIR